MMFFSICFSVGFIVTVRTASLENISTALPINCVLFCVKETLGFVRVQRGIIELRDDQRSIHDAKLQSVSKSNVITEAQSTNAVLQITLSVIDKITEHVNCERVKPPQLLTMSVDERFGHHYDVTAYLACRWPHAS